MVWNRAYSKIFALPYIYFVEFCFYMKAGITRMIYLKNPLLFKASDSALSVLSIYFCCIRNSFPQMVTYNAMSNC